MDELTRGPSINSQLIQLNTCRLYLNIIHLSDIFNPDGKTINNNFLIGCKPPYPSSKLKWPHQNYPSVKAWKLWNSTIRNVFNIQENLTLEPFSRLEEWLAPTSQRNINHQWNYSPSCQELTISTSHYIMRYFAKKGDYESMTINMDSQTKIEELQEDGIPVLLVSDTFKPLHKFKVTSCIITPPSTLPKHINALPRWSRTLIQNYRDEVLGPSLIELIQNRSEIIIASDGSKSESKSGGAWIIADSSGSISVSGSNPDFGPINLMNSHRSEIYAVLSDLLFLHEYCRYFILPLSSPVKYYCDNLEVVNKMKQLITDDKYYDEYIQTADHEAVHLLKKYLPNQLSINHVRSHQDKRKKKCNLNKTFTQYIVTIPTYGQAKS